MASSPGLIISFSSFLILFLWVGALAARQSKDTEDDYLLGSRSFGKWMIGLSAGATGNTSFILLAAVGIGYLQGFGSFQIWSSFFLGELCFWSFFAGRVSEVTESSRAESVAELVTTNLNSKAASTVRSLVSLLIFVFVGAYLVAQFAGSAKILNSFFGIDTTSGVLIALFAILAYCTTGGLRASIWTDIVQAIVMIAMTTGILLYALIDVGGPAHLLSALRSINPVLLDLRAGLDFWPLIAQMLGFAVMGAGFGLSQPHVTVRLMAGRNADEVRKARWIYLGFIYITGLSMSVFGICCRLLLPEISDPEQSLAVYSMASFAPWIVGLVLAGMFSTIASSADSQILACSSAISRDLWPSFSKRMTEKLGVRYQQIATILTGALGALATIYISSSVFELVIFSVSILAASIGTAMLVLIYNRPSSTTALLSSMIAGTVTALSWRFLGYDAQLSEVVPGVFMALAVHELVIYLFGPEQRKHMPALELPDTESEKMIANG